MSISFEIPASWRESIEIYQHRVSAVQLFQNISHVEHLWVWPQLNTNSRAIYVALFSFYIIRIESTNAVINFQVTTSKNDRIMFSEARSYIIIRIVL